jgi:hypothetical protein
MPDHCDTQQANLFVVVCKAKVAACRWLRVCAVLLPAVLALCGACRSAAPEVLALGAPSVVPPWHMPPSQWRSVALSMSFRTEDLEGTLPADFNFFAAVEMASASSGRLEALAAALLEEGAKERSSEADAVGAAEKVVLRLLRDEDWRVRGVIALVFGDILAWRNVKAAEVRSAVVESALRSLGDDCHMGVRLCAGMALEWSRRHKNEVVLAEIVRGALESDRAEAIYVACRFVRSRPDVLSGSVTQIGHLLRNVVETRLAAWMLESVAAVGTSESRAIIRSVAASHQRARVRDLAKALIVQEIVDR